jgi:acetoin utilization deacetylase AcuC-like enzyme
MRSTLDVGLADGTGDDEYFQVLFTHLPAILSSVAPDIAFYLAGVDPVQGDRYGRLRLTEAGIARRDRYVLEMCRNRSIPAVITIAGGYAPTAERTAQLHAIVFREAFLLRLSRVNGSGRPQRG